MNKVSIVEVAQQAGVSVATVSRVMSQSSYPVNIRTRERVLAAAAALQYSPNSFARGLKTNRSNLIAAIVGDNTNPYFAEIMRGVEEVCSEHGYLTIVCNTERQAVRERRYLEALRDYRVDGLLFAGSGINEPGYPANLEKIVAAMQQHGTAVVTLAQHTLHVPSTCADDFGGARAMTKHLIALGHRRIGFVTGPSNFVVANVRLQGYMAAMTEAGLEIEASTIVPGDFSMESGELAVRSLTRTMTERPTAIFAGNDEMAVGALVGLRQLGIHVPNDVSLGGFGDLPVARVVTPALTTVQMPLRELGRSGARKLLAMLREEPVGMLDTLPTTLIERQTTGPVAEKC